MLDPAPFGASTWVSLTFASKGSLRSLSGLSNLAIGWGPIGRSRSTHGRDGIGAGVCSDRVL